MPFCSNCGTEIPEGVKFCSNCGSAIGEVKTSTPEIETKPTYVAEPEKKKASPVFGIIAFVLAIIGFFGNPPALTIIVSIAAIVLAIISFVNKGKLKGFAIVAIVIAVVNILLTVGFSGTDTSSTTNEPEITATENSEVADKKEASTITNTNTESVESVVEKENTATENVHGVDPELKAFLDSYESFVNEYVEFMKNYIADPTNVVGMLQDYTDIMVKYDDFAKQIDAYDTDTMSTEDAKYYLDVTTRCTEKMIDLY